MSHFYYLVSSLPAIEAGSKSTLTYPQFLELCRNVVSPQVYETLENLSIESSKGPLVSQWSAFDASLRQCLNELRRERLGQKGEKAPYCDQFIRDAAQAAFDARNPLEAEQILLKAQFDYLDSLVNGHFFDDYNLYGYAIKLRLIERQTVFTHSEGRKEFDRLFENLQKQILSI